jgi:hypothetical protein
LGSGLVCLFDTSRSRFVQGILVHSTPEMATDMDVVLKPHGGRIETPVLLVEKYNLPDHIDVPPGPAPTSYPLVLCCDLYGQFLRTQLDKHIAHLDMPGCHPLFDVADVAATTGGYRGLPIFRGSPRWTEKERLLEEELRPLTYPFWEGFRW